MMDYHVIPTSSLLTSVTDTLHIAGGLYILAIVGIVLFVMGCKVASR